MPMAQPRGIRGVPDIRVAVAAALRRRGESYIRGWAGQGAVVVPALAVFQLVTTLHTALPVGWLLLSVIASFWEVGIGLNLAVVYLVARRLCVDGRYRTYGSLGPADAWGYTWRSRLLTMLPLATLLLARTQVERSRDAAA